MLNILIADDDPFNYINSFLIFREIEKGIQGGYKEGLSYIFYY